VKVSEKLAHVNYYFYFVASEWEYEFSKIATEEERYATIGCILDYSAHTNSYSTASIQDIKVRKDVIEISEKPIVIRARPSTGHSCDCRWGSCPQTGNYECKPNGTTGCSQTTVGCSFLWGQSCTHFCVDCLAWDCDNY